MSLIGVLRTGVSGMNAQSNRISTVAENIQNASTTGYKRTSAEFSSLLLDSGDVGNYNSGAVETTLRRSVSEGGPIASTNSDKDLAIQGNGFFVVSDAAGAPFMTRAGNFVVDGKTGNLVNAGGFTLMGYSLANGTPNPVLNGVADLKPVNVSVMGQEARPSTAATVSGNLSFETPVYDPTATGAIGYSKKNSLKVYDNVGRPVTLDVQMTKTAANTWSVEFLDPAPPSTSLGTTSVTFDGNGKITGSASTLVKVPNGGSIPVDLRGLTQLSGNHNLSGTADGSSPTSVSGTAFGEDGTVYAVYTDGTRKAAFKVPLADVASPDNLAPRAGNVFTTSAESGDIQVGFAGQGGRGILKAGALEQSNVDVSTELTTMIESQTVYTANSKVFMTGNELLETLMNLKR
ncbi:UNVERIFIED_ORG: flagellar hook protein FlgE [Methylobacterium sp. SuP10 SLI 274]|uniref:Flagellar hook protein FlgE n=1 Tax=Methylorubrum extorquens TaxID=408 RepID=A0A1S1P043_METEX|nr:flagellar hook protein FlgE [Methylorubrum extorquens]MDH6635615.1 flagellar hook protein FlgE [Methylobacterium sp. SuP10 SLI 274]MDH6664791.1 flagellar hook protein FlgE [Methylorubrum zatmanii]MCP1561787.1 flagellar hook protein FlgE [Methylorubrum extorquens]MDF9790293.1 flagellar hook protein FlgE [Methylorubrum extorquens]OHV14641.1 flagellar hook protein FlgE [Methylorubrum extorquens]